MFQKLPSVRELAGRIDALRAEALAHANRHVDAMTNLAAVRDEQRGLQRALEAEQIARMDSVAALHDRYQAATAELQAHISALTDRLEDLTDRLIALEGADEIPAAAETGPPASAAYSLEAADVSDGDTCDDPPASIAPKPPEAESGAAWADAPATAAE